MANLSVFAAAGQTVQTNAVDSGDFTSFQGWTEDDLQSRQAEDPDLTNILSWKQTRAPEDGCGTWL